MLLPNIMYLKVTTKELMLLIFRVFFYSMPNIFLKIFFYLPTLISKIIQLLIQQNNIVLNIIAYLYMYYKHIWKLKHKVRQELIHEPDKRAPFVPMEFLYFYAFLAFEFLYFYAFLLSSPWLFPASNGEPLLHCLFTITNFFSFIQLRSNFTYMFKF